MFQRFNSIEQGIVSCFRFCNCFSCFRNNLFNVRNGLSSNTILNVYKKK